VLPATWTTTTLGVVTEPAQYGWTTKAKSSGSGLKLLRTTDISDGVVDWDTVPFCFEEPPVREKYLLTRGDIVISRAGSIGLSALIECGPPAVFASYLIRFRTKTPINPRYVAWFLQSPAYWSQVEASASGIALQNVNAKKLSAITLPLAPLSEQTRIVATIEEHVSRLDAAVVALERVGAKLTRYWIAVLQAACGGRLVSRSNGNWTRITIGQCGQILTGRTPPTSRRDFYGNDVPFFKPGDLDQGYSVVHAEQHLSKQGAEVARVVPPMSVLVTCIGATIGKTGLTRVAGAFNQQVNAIVPAHGVDARYLFYFLTSPIGQELIHGNASATTLPILNKSKFSVLPLELPPLTEQQEIVQEVDRRLSLAEAAKHAVEAGLIKAKRLRQAILKRAFEGKLVAQDPNDEPASVLLERIRTARMGTRGKHA
jgi:type I restriction enzyme S subunit